MTTNRSILKSYFKKGAIPTEANFADLIDSMLNQADDQISKAPDGPLSVTAVGADETLLKFYHPTPPNSPADTPPALAWQLQQNPGAKPGLSIGDATASRLFIDSASGNVGIGATTTPKTKLRVEGGDISTTGDLCTERGRLAFSNVIGDRNHSIYNNGLNLDGEGAWDGMKMNVYNGLDVRMGDANGKTPPSSALRIDATGNVGIGTTTLAPYRLNVAGSALFIGNYLFVNSESAGRLRVGAAWGMPGLYSGDDGAKDLILGVPEGRKVYLGTATGDAYVEGGTGNTYIKGSLGIGTTTTPKTKLRVENGDISTTGNLCTERGRLAFSNVIGDANHTIYNNGTNVDKEGAWDGMKMNVYAGLDVRVGDASGKTPPSSALRIDQDGNSRIYDKTIFLRGGKDIYHGMGWFGGGKLFAGGNFDGPVLYGYSGGALGTSGPDQHVALSWNRSGDINIVGSLFEALEVIKCNRRGDWNAQDHPIMQYFKAKLSGKPVGTMLRAIQDHPDWRGHYWQGWVDADGRIRVIHNNINTTNVVA